MRNPPWNENENRPLVALYFVMLDKAQAGETYNKAAMIRHAQTAGLDAFTIDDAPLMNRSRGSIEAKLMNASAAHRDLDPAAVTMDGYGYKAAPNYQGALKELVKEALEERQLDADIATSQANEQRAGA